MKQFIFMVGLILSISSQLQAQNTFVSVQNGNWNDASTWTTGAGAGGVEGVDYPSSSDIVTIDHNILITATNSGSDFIFSGELTINENDTLRSQVGNNVTGFRLQGNGIMRNFGNFFTIDPTEQPDPFGHIPYSFFCDDNSVFIGGLNSFAFISDDWVFNDNAQIFLDNLLCYAISDDINVNGTNVNLYGSGNLRIGGDGAASTVNLNGGATAAQIDNNITIFRNASALACSGTSVVTGTNPDPIPPFAFDDTFTSASGSTENHNVLYQGADDFSPVVGDALTITSVGSDAGATNGTTSGGGTVTINNNGTPSDPSDDFVVYTPAAGFSGTDTYMYLITNNGGGTDIGTVTIQVTTCGAGFIEDTTLVVASAQSNNVGVNNAANVLGAPNGNFAEWFTGGDRVNIDFGQTFTQGTRYRITWRARSGNTNARPVIRESTTNGSFTTVATAYNIPDNTTISTLVIAENDFRFLQIEKVNAVNGTDFEIDAIEVLNINCSADNDNDGITDDNDIDDDNDGILDVDEADVVNNLSFTSSQVGGTNVTFNAEMQGAQNTVNVTAVGSDGMLFRDVAAGANSYLIEERPSVMGAKNTLNFAQPINNLVLSFQSLNIPQVGNFTITYQGGTQVTNVQPIIVETPIAGSGDTEVIVTGTSGGVHFIERGMTLTTQASGRITFANNDDIVAIQFEYLTNIAGSSIVIVLSAEGNFTIDSDNDGIGNALDLDSDNDGIADIVEAGGVDNNNDGIVDGTFTDSDLDGYSNVFDSDDGGTALPNPDTDGDGLPNSRDIDSDDDGIVDIIEAQASTSSIAPIGNDLDDDGIDDNFDGDAGNMLFDPVNTDGTDNPDYIDTDSDNDLTLDVVEAYDTDNDNLLNTAAEAADTDGDGLDNGFDNQGSINATTNVTNGGQTANTFPNLDNTATTERDWREIEDADGDGIADNADIDKDNDGIIDDREIDCVESITFPAGQAGGTNVTQNGVMAGNLNTISTSVVGTNGMVLFGRGGGAIGLGVQERPTVAGATMTINFDEPLSDVGLSFDGLSLPTIGNFVLTFADGSQATNAQPFIAETPIAGSGNTDKLIIINSGGTHAISRTGAGNPQASGRISFANNDNVVSVSFQYLNTIAGSSLTVAITPFGKPRADFDNDGVFNNFDIDSDNDGIPDILEAGGTDANGDGKADETTDTDQDGLSNAFDANNGGSALSPGDTDGDGINDLFDIDADNDGIIDNIEAQTTASFEPLRNMDTDGDGFDDRYDPDNGGTAITLSNFDMAGDGLDYLDLNSDGDAQPDWIEGFDDDEDGDALNDLIVRADNFESAAGDPGIYLSGVDSDNDNVPDFLEDADNDGLPNFLDPDNALYRDTDRDGLIDLYDADNFGVATTAPSGLSNSDGDAEPDFRDFDVAVGLPIELLAFQAVQMDDVVELTWSTLTEINNDFFTIERSTDGVNFEPILKESGAGNSTTRLDYVQYDRHPEKGYNYYRLMQTDYDGTEERFNIEVVYFTNGNATSGLAVFPNPSAGDVAYLQLDNLAKGKYQIEILNQFGQQVRVQNLSVEADQTSFRQELLQGQSLAAGVYYLRVTSEQAFLPALEAVRFIVK